METKFEPRTSHNGLKYVFEQPMLNVRKTIVDNCTYVRHSPAYKPERKPLRGVCGSYLEQSWNVEMNSSLQRVEKNSK
jgi:hypothetical protein